MAYLGLMENLRVRRAGYCNRQPYEIFLERYKVGLQRTQQALPCEHTGLTRIAATLSTRQMLSKDTWPNWHRDPKVHPRQSLSP